MTRTVWDMQPLKRTYFGWIMNLSPQSAVNINVQRYLNTVGILNYLNKTAVWGRSGFLVAAIWSSSLNDLKQTSSLPPLSLSPRARHQSWEKWVCSSGMEERKILTIIIANSISFSSTLFLYTFWSPHVRSSSPLLLTSLPQLSHPLISASALIWNSFILLRFYFHPFFFSFSILLPVIF